MRFVCVCLVLLTGCEALFPEDWPRLHLVVETEGAQLDRMEIGRASEKGILGSATDVPPLTPQLLLEGFTAPPAGELYFNPGRERDVEHPQGTLEWTLGAPFELQEQGADEVWYAVGYRVDSNGKEEAVTAGITYVRADDVPDDGDFTRTIQFRGSVEVWGTGCFRYNDAASTVFMVWAANPDCDMASPECDRYRYCDPAATSGPLVCACP